MATVTFIVPVYKTREDYLRICIESFLAQDSKEYQLILVDDGSPDQCGRICDEYAQRHAQVTVIHQKNQGVSVARNVGIQAVHTPWVTFIDSDDWIDADATSNIVSYVNGDASDADIIMYDYAHETKSGTEVTSLQVPSGFCTGTLLRECQNGPFFKMLHNGKWSKFPVISACTKVYRTEFLRENGLKFKEGLGRAEDLLFNADALNSTDKLFYVNHSYYHYRWYEESVTNKYTPDIVETTKLEIRELQHQIEKHHLSEETRAVLNCRICTRLYSCMRLYFFHPDNPSPKNKRMQELKQAVLTEPFSSAIKEADMQYFSPQEKIFVSLLKMKCYLGCELLVLAKSQFFKRRKL